VRPNGSDLPESKAAVCTAWDILEGKNSTEKTV
jgi:hypothetical protein